MNERTDGLKKPKVAINILQINQKVERRVPKTFMNPQYMHRNDRRQSCHRYLTQTTQRNLYKVYSTTNKTILHCPILRWGMKGDSGVKTLEIL